MRTIKNGLVFSTLVTMLTACSPIDSVHPFDQNQAAILLKQFYVSKPTQEAIVINLENRSHWKKINSSSGTLGTQLWLVPINQSDRVWQESIRTYVVAYHYFPDITLSTIFKRINLKAEAVCEKVESKILTETNNSLIYSMTLSHCKEEPNQKQVGKIFKGKDAMYGVYYTALENSVTPLHFEEYAKVIKRARLVGNEANRHSLT